MHMAATIMDEGILVDDISVISTGGTRGGEDLAPALTDATDYVGAPDEVDLDEQPTRHANVLRHAFDESSVGGGIATSSPDDAISSVGESDESQERAEDDSMPHLTEEMGEELERNQALRSGFATDVQVEPDTLALAGTAPDARKGLGSMTVSGVGTVMGGGDLATAALSDSDDGSYPSINEFLREKGVKRATAEALMRDFRSGGSILAVALSGGMGQANRLEELALAMGAKTAETISAPRF